LPFLAKNPRLCLRLYSQGSSLVLKALASSTESYAYWAKDAKTGKQYPPTTQVKMSKAANRAFALPIRLFEAFQNVWPLLLLPAAIALWALIFSTRIGRAPLLPVALFLAGTFYAQHAVSIFYEGTEDFRHALVGTAAFALLAWLACFSVAGKAIRFFKPFLERRA
jgi:hypothetical protein